MLRGYRYLLVGAVVAMGSLSATRVRGQANDTQKTSIAGGLAFTAELESALDSKKLKVGDLVVAHSTEALKVQGKTILANGTKLVGHVVQSAARANGDQDSLLAIQFEKAVLKSKEEIPIGLLIRAMARERRSWGNESGPGQDAMTDRIGTTTSPMANPPPPRPQENAGAAGTGKEAEQTELGLGRDGRLTASSRGVYGIEGIRLAADGSKAPPVCILYSSGKSVRVDSGTRLLFFTQAAESAQ